MRAKARPWAGLQVKIEAFGFRFQPSCRGSRMLRWPTKPFVPVRSEVSGTALWDLLRERQRLRRHTVKI